ncbi:GDYXXLXY domain-containing protein [Thauera butanivorans]|uniref:GDYXXLXY domain-containing protein n=1 Tax=Thauera butanivorans TaxID=86174 RepID=UPI003AB66CDE
MSRRSWLRIAVVASMALVLGVSLKAILDRERTLAQGRVVLLELAPVDPRSLMQGDYMALRFAIDRGLAGQRDGKEARDAPPATYALLALDADGRARLAGVADALPAGDTVAMRIHWRDGGPTVGPNAFFFQEGTAETYEAARWGEFRVAPDGSALLTHLRDEALTRLGEQRR